MRDPKIPMLPSELPKQRITVVTDLPPCPDPFEAIIGWEEVKQSGLHFPRAPQAACILGQIEWAWSPWHNRIDAYYRHRSRVGWILWRRYFDDNWERWEWLAVGVVPAKDITERDAAIWLLVKYLTYCRDENDVDHFHWINEIGELDASDWREIGRVVWGDRQQ